MHLSTRPSHCLRRQRRCCQHRWQTADNVSIINYSGWVFLEGFFCRFFFSSTFAIAKTLSTFKSFLFKIVIFSHYSSITIRSIQITLSQACFGLFWNWCEIFWRQNLIQLSWRFFLYCILIRLRLGLEFVYSVYEAFSHTEASFKKLDQQSEQEKNISNQMKHRNLGVKGDF